MTNLSNPESPDHAASKTIDSIDSIDLIAPILLREEALLPSSGFAASVMDAIQERALATEPIPFPWKLALPGMAALAAGAVLLIWLAVKTFADAQRNAAANMADSSAWLGWLHLHPELEATLRHQLGPVLLALAVSWLCVTLARRMAGISRGFSSR
jgi:hypothetical protein